MGIAIVVVIAVLGSQPSNSQPTAQCLSEIAAFTGDRISLLDDSYSVARRKYELVFAAHARSVASWIEMREAGVRFLATVRDNEAQGVVPRGSLNNERENTRHDLSDLLDGIGEPVRRAPSCAWTPMPAMPDL